MNVGELISYLAGLPPMLEIMSYDQDDTTIKFVNEFHLLAPDETSKYPVLFMMVSSSAYVPDPDDSTYDEKIAAVKHKALDLDMGK